MDRLLLRLGIRSLFFEHDLGDSHPMKFILLPSSFYHISPNF